MTFRGQKSCLQECLRSQFLILESVFFSASSLCTKRCSVWRNFLRSQYTYENLIRVQIECVAVCIVTSACVLVHILLTIKQKASPVSDSSFVKGLSFLHLLSVFDTYHAKPLVIISVQNKLLHLALDPSKSCDWFPSTNVFNYPKLKSGEDNLWTGLYGQIPY